MCASPPMMKAEIEMQLRTFDDLVDDIKALIEAREVEPFVCDGGERILLYPAGHPGERTGTPVTLAAVEQHLNRIAPCRMAAWN